MKTLLTIILFIFAAPLILVTLCLMAFFYTLDYRAGLFTVIGLSMYAIRTPVALFGCSLLAWIPILVLGLSYIPFIS